MCLELRARLSEVTEGLAGSWPSPASQCGSRQCRREERRKVGEEREIRRKKKKEKKEEKREKEKEKLSRVTQVYRYKIFFLSKFSKSKYSYIAYFNRIFDINRYDLKVTLRVR